MIPVSKLFHCCAEIIGCCKTVAATAHAVAETAPGMSGNAGGEANSGRDGYESDSSDLPNGEDGPWGSLCDPDEPPPPRARSRSPRGAAAVPEDRDGS